MTNDGSDLPHIGALLAPYNPWWESPKGEWREDLPPFERPLLAELLDDLRSLRQMISVTGPRRVGKTTVLRQLVTHLIDREDIPPDRILYLSLDDPAIFASPELQSGILDLLVEHRGVNRSEKGTVHYFLLDEIQRLPRWELFLKKYYDLHYPIRFIVSGSASSPIFRKSQESLVGRIKDRHLLPFSFREFCLYHLRDDSSFAETMARFGPLREHLLAGDGGSALAVLRDLDAALLPYWSRLDTCATNYWREGGFPEVWQISDPVRKQEFLWENQVRKVLFEDLALVTYYRKPENIARFILYLLSHPGAEINIAKIASDANVGTRVVRANLPLLEMTDLVWRVRKFRAQPLRVRQGNFKCYIVDLALRNAVMKTWHSIPEDDALMGLYAENAVANELRLWPEAIELTYYRQKDREVDFVVTSGGSAHLPIEVKHRRAPRRLEGLRLFMRKYDVPLGVVVTRGRTASLRERVLVIPLRYFLLMS